ncbi:hypothetical protein BgiBS90_033279 [Biomphalaria glabrata]|nr:hypothetical protein BgiBS90_033279 [Biomphalaria glabrata]
MRREAGRILRSRFRKGRFDAVTVLAPLFRRSDRFGAVTVLVPLFLAPKVFGASLGSERFTISDVDIVSWKTRKGAQKQFRRCCCRLLTSSSTKQLVDN